MPPGAYPRFVNARPETAQILDQRLSTDTSRNLVEIFDHGILTNQGNTLRVYVPDDEPGRN